MIHALLRELDQLRDAGETPRLAVTNLVQKILANMEHRDAGRLVLAHFPHNTSGYTNRARGPQNMSSVARRLEEAEPS